MAVETMMTRWRRANRNLAALGQPEVTLEALQRSLAALSAADTEQWLWLLERAALHEREADQAPNH